MKGTILFYHNKATWYRVPFFNRLAEIYGILFLFTDEDAVDGLRAPFKTFKRWGIRPFTLAPEGYAWMLFKDYSLTVLPPADTLGELFDFLVLWAIAKMRKKKIVVWSERWRSPSTQHSLKTRLYITFDEVFMRIVCLSATACATSGGIKQKEYFRYLGVKDEKIHIIPYVSEFEETTPSVSNPESLRFNLGTGRKKVILYVGRLVKRKGIEYLIKAFASIRKKREDVCLVIIGGQGFYRIGEKDSYSIEYLRNYSSDLELEPDGDIFFLGDVPHPGLPQYYRLCDVFVLPATAETAVEAWGLVVNEAMMFGKPVIATEAVGSAYTLIQNGENGFIIPENDSLALEEKIVYLLDNPEIANRMGENAKQFIDSHYRYAHMERAFQGMIESILKG